MKNKKMQFNSKNIMKTVECSGSPRAMGRQYGEESREEILFEIEHLGKTFQRPGLEFWYNRAERLLASSLPELREELHGIAEGAGTDHRLLLAMNFVDTFDNRTDRCTPLLLHDSPEGMIVAKNNDAGANEKCQFVTLIRRPDHGIPTVTVTYAGWLSGLDSMNSEGLANTHGSVGSKFDRSGDRVDIRLVVMHAMQSCRTASDFYEKLQSFPLTGKGFSIAVGDRTGHSFFLDAAVPKLVKRSENIPFSWSANLYYAPEVEFADMRAPDYRPFCVERSQYIAKQEAPHDLAGIKRLLSDHSCCHAPCRHGGEAHSLTKWSMIALPEKGEILLADGLPCETPYETIEI